MSESRDPVRLTTTVQKGGCAAKVAASELRRILGALRFPPSHPELLVDGQHFDDAAIYRIHEDLALVQTLDFFTPIVDDPRTFGRIAATNALSDVYAMGGQPKTAMAILAFPLATLPTSAIQDVLQGACDTLTEARANLVGGHSIDDETLKFGLSVTGFVHPQQVWSNTGARENDVLILSKPLGTGTATAALKRQAVKESEIEDVLVSMCALNNVIDWLPNDLRTAIHAATDVTGFGLSGHAMQMAKASGVTLKLQASLLPCFPRTQEFIEREFLTKAHRSNREYTKDFLRTTGLDSWQELLLHDPQTSGGLLLSVQPDASEAVISALRPRFPATIVGEVVAAEPPSANTPTSMNGRIAVDVRS